MYLSLVPTVLVKWQQDGVMFPPKEKYMHATIFNFQLIVITSYCSPLMYFANHIKARGPPTQFPLSVYGSVYYVSLFIFSYQKSSVYKTRRIKSLLIKKLLITQFDRFLYASDIFAQLQRNVPPKQPRKRLIKMFKRLTGFYF